MPDVAKLFAPSSPNVPQTTGAQCFEADVVRSDDRGVYVVIPGFDKTLAWGPCLPAISTATVGDRVTVVMSNQGRPWLVGQGGGDPNIDGGAPDSVYEPNPGIDGGAI